MTRDVESRIVCPQNADNHCTGPALDLDAKRQAYFFATLGRPGPGDPTRLIATMAVDGMVKAAVDAALDELGGKGAFPAEVIDHTKELVYGETADLMTGWYRFHHNHTHLRFLWQPTEVTTLNRIVEAKVARLVRGGGLAAEEGSSQPAVLPQPAGLPLGPQPAGP